MVRGVYPRVTLLASLLSILTSYVLYVWHFNVDADVYVALLIFSMAVFSSGLVLFMVTIKRMQVAGIRRTASFKYGVGFVSMFVGVFFSYVAFLEKSKFLAYDVTAAFMYLIVGVTLAFFAYMEHSEAMEKGGGKKKKYTSKEDADSGAGHEYLPDCHSDGLYSLIAKDYGLSPVPGVTASELLLYCSIDEKYRNMANRTLGEIEKIRRGSAVNLWLGVIIAVSGLLYLVATYGYNLVYRVEGVELLNFEAISFAKRVTFLIGIELLAFFFLNNYRNCLHDIRYYHNEVTNIDQKIAAVLIAIKCNDTKLLNKIQDGLVGSERNSVLKKGETTLELEKIRLDLSAIGEVSKGVKDILNIVKK